MLRGGLSDRRGFRQHSGAMKLFDGHFQLSELSTELLQELGLTLLHAQELLLYKPDACQQALLHRLHSCGRVGEGTLQLALERLLVGAERLKVALEDAGDIVVGLEHLVLQCFEAVRLPVARCRCLEPGRAVQVMLAAEVSNQLRDLDQRHGTRSILDVDDVRRLRS